MILARSSSISFARPISYSTPSREAEPSVWKAFKNVRIPKSLANSQKSYSNSPFASEIHVSGLPDTKMGFLYTSSVEENVGSALKIGREF